MLPIIVLIGRTNVGKSTLFNILTKKRNALVSNISGLTRDRNYDFCYLEKNKKFILTDTSGFDFESKIIKTQAYKQTLIAIQEADLILFMVNAREGILPQEYEILKKIRKYQKETFLVINKIDGIKEDEKINDFYSLGIKKIIKISASHNQGINYFINKYLIPWMQLKFKKNIIPKKLEIEKKSMKIACIGKPNVGKSTLINALVMQNRIITSNIPGTTLDTISVPIQYNNKNYILIDTAGISKKQRKKNKIEQISVIKTLETVNKTDITLLIIDAKNEQNEICNQNLLLINIIEKCGKPLIVIINKWDLLSFSEKNKFKKLIKYQLKNSFVFKIHFVSALNSEGIFEIFKFVNNFNQSDKKQINTSKLMQIMQEAVKKHQPPIINGRRIKLKYVHLGSSYPIRIIIHGNQTRYLSLTYKKYLKNFFYQALQINGVPITIKFKETINPYI
ncbi:ribosome biogenesis GTPase Der [Buchnera aphidicola (Aphis helianthi)]|uniref:GTPase Der n=1 Tax=Buchnera aphidicola (Aphis helianthi) TaxID=2315802 RepID=A0A4D6XR27_9GAMM|nr:ribosome biogenesis GTPase Der [Buchnera aphidicola]QCI17397.1 ribosome biogenesis GTPase Der [Buchnera aphidicola (Aphis helianthi)]